MDLDESAARKHVSAICGESGRKSDARARHFFVRIHKTVRILVLAGEIARATHVFLFMAEVCKLLVAYLCPKTS